jgi:hypothetical protein
MLWIGSDGLACIALGHGFSFPRVQQRLLLRQLGRLVELVTLLGLALPVDPAQVWLPASAGLMG